MNTIIYPYIPPNRHIRYVSAEHPYMVAAKTCAHEESLDTTMPVGSVVVLDGVVVGRGANGSNYHKTNVCERVLQGVPSGTRYDLCEGCHPKNHSERKAVADALANGYSLVGASLYSWGHWWACESCWSAIIEAGIKDVYFMEKSEVLFNRDHPGNIIGRQFA